MKKIIGVIVGLIVLGIAGTAIAGPPATNPQGDFLDLSVAATPPVSGTAKLPRGVGVTFSTFTGNRINANDIENNSSLSVVFHNNFAYNGLKFPSCAINTKALSVCSKASKIGAGSGEGMLLASGGAPPTFVPASLTVYNGKPLTGHNPTVIFIGSLGGKPTIEYDFVVEHAGSGIKFVELTTPGNAGTGPVVYLTKFTFAIPLRSETGKVNGHATRTYLIDAPTSCHGSWSYSQTFTFTNRPTLTATDTQPCVKG